MNFDLDQDTIILLIIICYIIIGMIRAFGGLSAMAATYKAHGIPDEMMHHPIVRLSMVTGIIISVLIWPIEIIIWFCILLHSLWKDRKRLKALFFGYHKTLCHAANLVDHWVYIRKDYHQLKFQTTNPDLLDLTKSNIRHLDIHYAQLARELYRLGYGDEHSDPRTWEPLELPFETPTDKPE